MSDKETFIAEEKVVFSIFNPDNENELFLPANYSGKHASYKLVTHVPEGVYSVDGMLHVVVPVDKASLGYADALCLKRLGFRPLYGHSIVDRYSSVTGMYKTTDELQETLNTFIAVSRRRFQDKVESLFKEKVEEPPEPDVV